MKQGVRRPAAIPVLFAVLGLTAQTLVGCAVGSNLSARGDGTDSGSGSGDGSASSGDSASESPSGIDAGRSEDSGSAGDTGGGVDSATAADSSSVVDSGVVDSGSDADSGFGDAAPAVIFGPDCVNGTTYTELFTSDPVADGTFLPLAGSYTYDAANSRVSLAASSANAQLWIGPRATWTSYTISASVRIDTANGNGGFTFRMESTPASPSNNAGQMYYAGIATNQVLLGLENGNWTEFSGPSATFAVGTFYALAVTANGTSLSVSVDGKSYVTSYADTTYTFGSFGLRSFASGMTYGAITVTCH
jgi:hypothetical protein